MQAKECSAAILMSEKIEFTAKKSIARDKKVSFVIIKESKIQEN